MTLVVPALAWPFSSCNAPPPPPAAPPPPASHAEGGSVALICSVSPALSSGGPAARTMSAPCVSDVYGRRPTASSSSGATRMAVVLLQLPLPSVETFSSAGAAFCDGRERQHEQQHHAQ